MEPATWFGTVKNLYTQPDTRVSLVVKFIFSVSACHQADPVIDTVQPQF